MDKYVSLDKRSNQSRGQGCVKIRLEIGSEFDADGGIMHYGGFMNIVVYGSQYGTAKRYAEELAYRVGYELESYEDVTDINTYETIVYIGALYAGGVMGMKKTFKNMKI